MCMYDSMDDEGVFLGATWQATRYPRRCVECARTINKGEQYRRSVHAYNGRADAWVHCVHCVAAAEWLVKVCNGYVYEAVGEDLREHWWEGYANLDLGYRIIGIRRQWQRFDGQGLMAIPGPVVLREGAKAA